MSVSEVLSGILLAAGIGFVVTGSIGLFRLPDFFTRTHAAGVMDSAGAALILAGLLLQSETFATAIRLVLILLFLFVTSPTASHALARAALQDGAKPLLNTARKR